MMRAATVVFLLLCPVSATLAQADDAVQYDVFASSDSDGNEQLKTGAAWLYDYRDADRWRGFKVERARFSGADFSETEARIYFRIADVAHDWRWRASIGSNSDALLGSFNVWKGVEDRKEFFVEREIVETRQGLERGIYQTFAGAAIDIPLTRRLTATGLAGVQDFTGDNLRTHLRGNVTYVLREDWGLSAQLRSRWFHDSEPREFDYFAPGDYAEALGLLALRRRAGTAIWRAAAGWGRQHSRGDEWKRARFFEAGVELTPDRPLQFRLRIGYTDTPVGANASADYAYRYAMIEGTIPL